MTKNQQTAFGILGLAVMILAMLFGLAQAKTQYSPVTFYAEQPPCKDAREMWLLRSRIGHVGSLHLATSVWVCGLGGR